MWLWLLCIIPYCRTASPAVAAAFPGDRHNRSDCATILHSGI